MTDWISADDRPPPKDGTVVDLWIVHPHQPDGRRIADAYWWRGDKPGWLTRDEILLSAGWRVTHWVVVTAPNVEAAS